MWNLIGDDGEVTADNRTSQFVEASSTRGLSCPNPGWSGDGKNPPAPTWQSLLTVYEGGLAMPSPRTPPVFTWTAAAPIVKVPADEIQVKTRKNVRSSGSVEITVDYPYDHSDLIFTVSSNSSDDVSKLAVDGTGPNRIVSFAITTDKKDTWYELTVTVQSKSTKQKGSGNFVVKGNGFNGYGEVTSGVSLGMRNQLGDANMATIVEEVSLTGNNHQRPAKGEQI